MTPVPPVSESSHRAWLIAQATYLVLFVTFIAVLGGLHPSADGADASVVWGAALVALVNLPWCFVLARRLEAARPRGPAVRAAAGLVGRLAFAAWVLHFVAVTGHANARHGSRRRSTTHAAQDASAGSRPLTGASSADAPLR